MFGHSSMDSIPEFVMKTGALSPMNPMRIRKDVSARSVDYVTKVPVARAPGVAYGFNQNPTEADPVSVYGIGGDYVGPWGAVAAGLPPRDQWNTRMLAAAKKAEDAARATGAPTAEIKIAGDAAALAVQHQVVDFSSKGALAKILAPVLTGAVIGAVATCKGRRLKGAGLGALAAAGLGVAAMLVARLK